MMGSAAVFVTGTSGPVTVPVPFPMSPVSPLLRPKLTFKLGGRTNTTKAMSGPSESVPVSKPSLAVDPVHGRCTSDCEMPSVPRTASPVSSGPHPPGKTKPLYDDDDLKASAFCPPTVPVLSVPVAHTAFGPRGVLPKVASVPVLFT